MTNHERIFGTVKDAARYIASTITCPFCDGPDKYCDGRLQCIEAVERWLEDVEE